MSTWLLARQAGHGAPPATVPGRWMIAVGRQTACGARTGDGRAVHLFAALDQDTGAVLGQTAVEV